MKIENSQPKVAVFYDWLNQWGGAERVLLDILSIYPGADLYTLVHDPKKSKWLPQNTKIRTSFINKLPFARHNPIFYTWLYPIAAEQFDFSSYDLVISTTSTVGHCLLTPPFVPLVCYVHNINRHLYFSPTKYFLLKPLLSLYKKIDKIFISRPDLYLTNSHTVQERITNYYHQPSIIINPGIDTDKFKPALHPPQDYFLVVSRLVGHKKVILAVDACHQLNLKLFIVGSGRDYQKINRYINNLKDNNIKLLGQISDSRLIDLYQHCQALICPQEEDFGITPLECQACGRPVIAFGRGGITETVINHKTGIFFDSQTTESLKTALTNFKLSNIDTHDCRTQALSFSKHQFMIHFKQQIESIWPPTLLHKTILSSSFVEDQAPVSGRSPVLPTPNNF